MCALRQLMSICTSRNMCTGIHVLLSPVYLIDPSTKSTLFQARFSPYNAYHVLKIDN